MTLMGRTTQLNSNEYVSYTYIQVVDKILLAPRGKGDINRGNLTTITNSAAQVDHIHLSED